MSLFKRKHVHDFKPTRILGFDSIENDADHSQDRLYLFTEAAVFCITDDDLPSQESGMFVFETCCQEYRFAEHRHD